jgi:DNA-binding Lrp family transcriptional regulator
MKFEGIVESSLVYGAFDIHCKLDVESMERLRKVHDKINKLRILTSQTLIAYKRAPRKRKRLKNHKIKPYSSKTLIFFNKSNNKTLKVFIFSYLKPFL